MLALIAGRGLLPDHVVAARGGAVLVVALEGFAPDRLTPDITFRVEHLGSFINDIKARGVTEICLAGATGRPALDPAMLDAATMPLVPRMMQALGQGDDGALRAVLAIFEEAGLIVRAAHEICPELLLAEGVPTRARPGPEHEDAARLGAATLVELGRADQGQACVIHHGEVLAREDAAGTDAMLDGLDRRDSPGRTGAILYKAPKPDQDRRVDLPAIGPETAQRAADAGLDGIVIEASAVFVLDLPACLRILDDRGLFLWARGS